MWLILASVRLHVSTSNMVAILHNKWPGRGIYIWTYGYIRVTCIVSVQIARWAALTIGQTSCKCTAVLEKEKLRAQLPGGLLQPSREDLRAWDEKLRARMDDFVDVVEAHDAWLSSDDVLYQVRPRALRVQLQDTFSARRPRTRLCLRIGLVQNFAS